MEIKLSDSRRAIVSSSLFVSCSYSFQEAEDGESDKRTTLMDLLLFERAAHPPCCAQFEVPQSGFSRNRDNQQSGHEHQLSSCGFGCVDQGEFNSLRAPSASRHSHGGPPSTPYERGGDLTSESSLIMLYEVAGWAKIRLDQKLVESYLAPESWKSVFVFAKLLRPATNFSPSAV